VAFFGTGTYGNVYHRLIRVSKELAKRGWEIYGFGYDPTKHEQYVWQQDMQDIGLKANMEYLVRQSHFSIFQLCQTELATAYMEALQEVVKIPILTDMDDDPFNVDAWNPGVRVNTMGEQYQIIAAQQLKLCNGVLVSTDQLKEVALEYNPQVWVVPNTVDDDWKNLTNARRLGGKIRIGWQGASAHRGNLRIIKNVVTAILEKYPQVEFYFWGPWFPDWAKHPRILTNEQFVLIHDYPKAFSELGWDINVCPLQDTLFNRAKSNIRWMDGAALKIPSVVSRTRAYECVRDGEDGLIAQDEGEWIQALSRLIEDRSFRRRIGAQAHQRVWKDFPVGKAAAVYEQIFQHYLPLNQELNKASQEAHEDYLIRQQAILASGVIKDETKIPVEVK